MLKDEIVSEVEKFRNCSSREDKQKILVARRLDCLRQNRERLKSVYRTSEILKKLDNNNINPDNFDVTLFLCETDIDVSAWNYLRSVVSSLPNTGYYGRNMKYLVIEKNSDRILGIFGLGSDFMAFKPRDDYIGWAKGDKFGKKYDKDGNRFNGSCSSWKSQKEQGIKIVGNKINNLMNIHTCVSLEPFGILTVGKLMAMLTFSDEVLDSFQKKYGQKLVGITTTSIYGKSIQYSGIADFMKLVGYTKGIGTLQFNENLISLIRDYYKKNYLQYGWQDPSYLGLQPKAKMITVVCKHLGLKTSILSHGHKKGIYFGYTFVNSRDYLKGRNGVCIDEKKLKKFKDRRLNDIVNLWKQRFFNSRKDKFVNKYCHCKQGCANDYIIKSPYAITDIFNEEKNLTNFTKDVRK